MSKRFGKETDKDIASERVDILFNLAKRKGTPKALQKRYVHLARGTAMKYRLKLDKSKRRSFCKKCGSVFVSDEDLRVRVRNGRVVYTCKACGNQVVRVPLNKQK